MYRHIQIQLRDYSAHNNNNIMFGMFIFSFISRVRFLLPFLEASIHIRWSGIDFNFPIVAPWYASGHGQFSSVFHFPFGFSNQNIYPYVYKLLIDFKFGFSFTSKSSSSSMSLTSEYRWYCMFSEWYFLDAIGCNRFVRWNILVGDGLYNNTRFVV